MTTESGDLKYGRFGQANHRPAGRAPRPPAGGDLEIVGIEGKTVKLKLRGACGGCPHAAMTIKGGLERILREEIDPEIVIERVI